jgi:MFS family permease
MKADAVPTDHAAEVAAAEARDWTPRSIYTLLFLSLIYSFNFFDRNLFGLLMPLVKADFQLSDTALALISGMAFILFYSAAGVPIARLADVANRRTIIAVSFTVWSLVTALSGLATSVWQLVVLRFLQGAGEAGGVPPSQSMVSDIFSKRRRPLALAIVSAGSAFAGLVLTPLSGVLGELYGWRVAFMAAGFPGVALGLVFWATVREPPRGATEAKGVNLDQASFMESVGFLVRQNAFLFLLLGGAVFGIVTAINFTWSVTFLVRVHHLSMSEIGFTVGPIRGLIGAGSGILGAVIAQRLGKRDERWALWVPAAGTILAAPCEILFLMAPTPGLALVGLSLQSLFGGLCMPALYAACLSLARVRMRTLASAIYLLAVNLVGQVVGPLAVGVGTDLLTAEFASDAIRYSMLIVMPLSSVTAGVCFLLAARMFPAGAARAADAAPAR